MLDKEQLGLNACTDTRQRSNGSPNPHLDTCQHSNPFSECSNSILTYFKVFGW